MWLLQINYDWSIKRINIIIVRGVDSILGGGPKGLKARTKKDELGPLLWIIKESVPSYDSWGVQDMLPTLKLSSKETNMGDLR